MAQHAIWQTRPDGVLVAEADGLRLIVQAPDRENGAVHFLVRQRSGEGESLTGSGTADGVQAAMESAVRMAERFLGHSFGAAPGRSR
jgi:hypothetical protein